MIIASWSSLLGDSWPKQLKLVTVGTIGDHCVCQRVALDWGKVFQLPWLVNVMSNQVDLPGHYSSGRTYWTGSGAVGTSQKDCCRRFCQVPASLLFVKKACENRQKDLFVVFQEWSACLQGRDGHPAEAHLGGLLPCLYLNRRFNVRLVFPRWISVYLCNFHLEQNQFVDLKSALKSSTFHRF